ncbi:hypothetical protein ATANTOWER_024288 [Ataeniobius toweri]|uniref:Uncharacterized protein n=1 Tax=Ataeniobius toweri TaxID=208326 RepID=A0ABU7BUQ0_9TELE|nr:hypothetical protein [Ataeniobius toweri]
MSATPQKAMSGLAHFWLMLHKNKNLNESRQQLQSNTIPHLAQTLRKRELLLQPTIVINTHRECLVSRCFVRAPAGSVSFPKLEDRQIIFLKDFFCGTSGLYFSSVI